MKIDPVKIFIRLIESILLVFFIRGGSLIRFFMGEKVEFNIFSLDIFLVIIFFAIFYSNDLRQSESR